MIKGLDIKSKAVFDELEHKYYLDGKDLISTTQLMRKHHLAPDYSTVDEETLRRSADYGRLVHKELEMFIKKDRPSYTQEVENFEMWIKENQLEDSMIESELQVNNDIVAGTIDFIYQDDNGLVIADFKTTSQVHKDSVSWQLSIYRELLGMEINKGVCFHIKGGLFEVIDIPLKSHDEVNKLFDAERKGEIYQTNDLIPVDSVEALIDFQMQLMAMEETKKKIEAQQEAFKDYVMQEMEKRGLLSYKVVCNGIELSLTRVLESKRESVDTKLLKAENPDIYEKYKKTTITKGYVKVACKPYE